MIDPDAIPRPPAVVAEILSDLFTERAINLAHFAERMRDYNGTPVGPTRLLSLTGPLLTLLDQLERECHRVDAWLPPKPRKGQP